MSNEITIGESGTESPPTFGMDHPTVNVTYPDGAEEPVDPEYEIVVANTMFDADLGETRVDRLELTDTCEDHWKIQQEIADARGAFEADYGYPALEELQVELVYFRTVGDEKTLCVQLRGPVDHRTQLSQLSMYVDERLRSA